MHMVGIFLAVTDVKNIPAFAKYFSYFIDDVSFVMRYLQGNILGTEPDSH